MHEVRIPIGAVGANFEARPNVALDVAGQLLKSLNTAVLRTGGAALGTVTVLVDEVLRPALESAGLPPGAVGLVRSADREGAACLVTMPRRLPLVILRGSGATTAELARLAASNGVRTLAHAEGGGVLYVHAAATREKAVAARAGEPRPARRLQPAQPPARRPRGRGAPADLLAALRERGVEVRGTERAAASAGVAELDVPLEHEWANDAGARRDGDARPRRRPRRGGRDRERAHVRPRRRRSSPRTRTRPQRFLAGYRGTAAFWNAPTRFVDGFELTGAPETGINVDWTSRAARARHLPRPPPPPVPDRRGRHARRR